MTSLRAGLSGCDRDARSALGILDVPTPTGHATQLVLQTDRDQEITVHVEGNGPSWLRPTIGRFSELLQLPENWDSYGGRRLEPRSLVFALDLLSETMLDTTPSPSIVPTSDGGMQLEWHMHGIDLEIGVTPEGVVTAACEDAVDGSEWEDEDGPDVRQLRSALAALTRRA